METLIDLQPGEPAPASGLYRQISALGAPTEVRVLVTRGDPLPEAPHGCGWRRQKESDERAGAPSAAVARYRRAASGRLHRGVIGERVRLQ
jgi:hypothetical protein